MEAALLCPLLCLVVCLMLSMTVALYERVVQYGAECVEELETIPAASVVLRMEHVAGNIWEQLAK